VAHVLQKTIEPVSFFKQGCAFSEKGDAPALLIRLLDLLFGFAAVCGTCFDSLMPYCDGMGMSDCCSCHFVNSTFDKMRCAIRPPIWQALLISV
jgi:hypothetical protein